VEIFSRFFYGIIYRSVSPKKQVILKTMKTITTIGALLFVGMTFAQNTFGDIIGTFKSADKKESLFGALVYTSRGEEVFRTLTNEEGRFRISAVPPGEYTVYFVYEGDTVVAPKKAEVAPDGFGDLGIVTNIAIKTIAGGEVIAPILSLGKGVAPEIKMGRKDIKVLPIKFEAAKMVASMTTDVRMTDDGQLVFRGARKGDMISYIDGVKMEGIQNVPSASLGYIMVYAGAIPAKYGDTTGGVVIMETLSYFDLLREWEARNE
jgi:hypothetical protein